MDWRNRLPRPAGWPLPADLQEILKMSPEEYRRHLRAEGFSDGYIDRELAQLERARERKLIRRPADPAPPPPADAGDVEFLLRRRKERQRRKEDAEE